MRSVRKDDDVDVANRIIPAYIVEKENGEVLEMWEFHKKLHDPSNNVLGYSKGTAMMFTIDKPIHKHIFKDLKYYEIDQIEEIYQASKRMGLTPFQLMKRIDTLSEKYPEKVV